MLRFMPAVCQFNQYFLLSCHFSVNDIAVISDEDTLMRIKTDGKVSWSPGGVFITNCEADVTYYPLDTQECR